MDRFDGDGWCVFGVDPVAMVENDEAPIKKVLDARADRRCPV
jgi:hypothetical protein